MKQSSWATDFVQISNSLGSRAGASTSQMQDGTFCWLWSLISSSASTKSGNWKCLCCTVLLTYDPCAANAHLLLGTAVFKWNCALCRQCQPAWPPSKRREFGHSIFYSGSQDSEPSPANSDPCDLVLACIDSHKQVVERESMRTQLSRSLMTSFSLSRSCINWWIMKKTGMHGTFSTFAQAGRESCTQVGNYRIWIWPSLLLPFCYRVHQFRAYILIVSAGFFCAEARKGCLVP